MKRNIMLVIFLIGLITFFSLINRKAQRSTATVNNKTFNIEIARTEDQQEVGLSKYDKIEDNFGMYFLFNKPNYYNFWMKDMKFPIDIIYIYKNEIVQVFKNVPNPKTNLDPLMIYKPTHTADSVLEIKAGLSDKYGISEGEVVKTTIK